MKRLSWKYIAGLIDGEGCLDVQALKRKYVRPRLRVTMAENCNFIMEMLHANHGGHLYLQNREFSNPEWQNASSWEITGFKVTSPFLRNITNHLYIKKEQARFLIWMEQTVKGKHVSDEVIALIRSELKAMKRDPHRLSEKAQEQLTKLL